MKKIDIDAWANLREPTRQTLLLRNGASIARHSEFSYRIIQTHTVAIIRQSGHFSF